MIKSRFLVSALAVLGLLGVSLAGCSGGGKPAAQDSPADVKVDTAWQPPKSAFNSHIYVSETDRIQYPPQVETNLLAAAVKAELVKCMKKQGFTVNDNAPQFQESLTDDLPESGIENADSYISPENAVRWGTSTKQFEDSKHIDEVRQLNGEAYDKALNGGDNPKTDPGCLSMAKEHVLLNEKKIGDLFNQIAKIPLQAEELTEKYRKELEKKWATCMRNAGLPQYSTVDSTSSPTGVEGAAEWPEPVSAQEIKVAKTSGQCMISTGYLEKYSKYQAQAVHALLAKKPGLITEWQKLHRAQIKHAQEQLQH